MVTTGPDLPKHTLARTSHRGPAQADTSPTIRGEKGHMSHVLSNSKYTVWVLPAMADSAPRARLLFERYLDAWSCGLSSYCHTLYSPHSHWNPSSLTMPPMSQEVVVCEPELLPHCRRMVETFVEVVRRGIENRDELSVTYTVPSRSDEDGEQADRDSEDLPDLMPIRDGEAMTYAALRARHGNGSLTSLKPLIASC